MIALRVGISGCGKAGRATVLQSRRHTLCDVVAAHDPDPRALAGFTEATSIRSTHTTYDALLATGIDFVVLAGPCGDRLAQVRAAADQGVHCLLLGPMAPDAATAALMVEAADRGGVRLGVAVRGQDDPVFEQLRAMLAADWLGGPIAVQALAAENPLLEAPPPAGDWRLDPSRAGADPLLVVASHHVHLASWLLGRSVVRVTAQSVRGALPLPADGTAATAHFRGNVLGTFHGSHLAHANAFAVHGTDGGLRIAGDRLWLHGRTEYRGDVFDYPHPGAELQLGRESLRDSLASRAAAVEPLGRFARWIDDSDDFPCPAEQALEDQRVLDAIARAAASGRAEVP